MASFENITVTREGRATLALALANQTPLKFVRMEVGSGEAPAEPEELTALVEKVLDVPISRISAGLNSIRANTEEEISESETRSRLRSITLDEPGVTRIRGAFRTSSLPYDEDNKYEEGFELREIGLYATVYDSDPVLFAYANSGDTADFIPRTGLSSVMEEVIILSLVTGNAKVIIDNIDPTVAATLEDIEERIADLNIDKLKEDIGKIREDIEIVEETATQFVSKNGDTMEGPLVVPDVTGHLTGSADMWGGWKIFNTIEEINLSMGSSLKVETSTVEEISRTMPMRSRFITYLPQKYSPYPFPGIGMLEIQKISNEFAMALFTADHAGGYMGECFKKFISGKGNSNWMASSGMPIGSIIAWDAPYSLRYSPPPGFLLPWGQELRRDQYPMLFSHISTTYGAPSNQTFRLPDLKGLFIRGWDPDRGIDPGRQIGTYQEDTIFNITGSFDGNIDDHDWPKTGPFYWGGELHTGSNGNRDSWGGIIRFDLSRATHKISHEVRPKNFALNYIYKY